MRTKTTMAAKLDREAERAAGVARHVSRLLAKGGFPRRLIVKGRSTKGFYVGRVGYSSSISIGWNHGNGPWFSESANRECREKLAELVAFLRGCGVAVDDRGWIETRGEP